MLTPAASRLLTLPSYLSPLVPVSPAPLYYLIYQLFSNHDEAFRNCGCEGIHAASRNAEHRQGALWQRLGQHCGLHGDETPPDGEFPTLSRRLWQRRNKCLDGHTRHSERYPWPRCKDGPSSYSENRDLSSDQQEKCRTQGQRALLTFSR